MTDYDVFAPFYDAVMGNRTDVMRLIARQIKKHLPEALTLLELGCGTGSILEGLAKDYQIAGIERSPEMLQQAKAKLPSALLVQGTIAGFDLDQTFDVAICVFDTINHLTSFSEWRGLFQSTLRHLNPGGLLIFDMNTTGRLQAVSASPGYIQAFNRRNTFQLRASLIAPNRVEWHVSVEKPTTDKSIQVYEEYIQEATFPLKQVNLELRRCGFTILDCFASDTRKPSDISDRVYFVCKSPRL